MLKQNGSDSTESERKIVITRVFNAPRELVFKAWTEPQHIAQWWGPKGFTTRVTELDLRLGGRWRYVMISPDGTEYPAKGVFREIVPPERIVTTDEFDEGFEQVINAELPQGIVMTAIFEDVDGKTKLTLEIVHKSASDRRKHEEMGVVAGWNSSFDCLDEFLAKQVEQQHNGFTLTLPSDREIIITRVFNAPRRLLFEAWTQPEHVKRWFGGCSSMTMTVCEIDLRVGGSWRYVLHDSSNGTDHGFSGEYREIVPSERLVSTERYEPVPNSDRLNTLTLTEEDGKTTLHIHIQHQSREQRDGHLQSGMEVGLRQTLNRLEELLQSMSSFSGN
ncbi:MULTISPECIES: SRPBCC family protein [Nostoc]|uniref:SRPBCC domain-containing protein n=1 Tax=Nostoc paludosum FACHB-159 TaxID=2692908 RepID=A0ABR8K4E7_9NOSO|nr:MULTISPECIES: SRPBCC family protein [Nostoc]MBD2677658.1 SRPBCC domain-containing protein [Nostoc sp. FACHB-857]MBD2733706.1 SRPBCC domain-containing protein [Nostoc paludosum FACHB-159]